MKLSETKIVEQNGQKLKQATEGGGEEQSPLDDLKTTLLVTTLLDPLPLGQQNIPLGEYFVIAVLQIKLKLRCGKYCVI